MHKLPIFFLLGILFLFFPQEIIASSIAISSSQTSLSAPNEEFVVSANLSVSAPNGTTYYLRGEFYLPDTSAYCGFTWNGQSWYNGPYTSSEGWKNLSPVVVQDNSWSGELKAKFDMEDSGCLTSGNYNFRVQRYTSAGNASSDTEDPISVLVSVPTPSPTPTVEATSTPTTASTAVSTPTAAPTLTPTPTKKPTPKPTPKVTPTPEILGEQASDAALAQSQLSATSTSDVDDDSGKKFPILAVIFVLLGVGLVGFSIFSFVRGTKKGYTSESENPPTQIS